MVCDQRGQLVYQLRRDVVTHSLNDFEFGTLDVFGCIDAVLDGDQGVFTTVYDKRGPFYRG
jgi:hypothetical protein